MERCFLVVYSQLYTHEVQIHKNLQEMYVEYEFPEMKIN